MKTKNSNKTKAFLAIESKNYNKTLNNYYSINSA